MLIRNAVIPVAGHGTRLLPATKSQPKEMLPVGKKPIVQYVVEELAACHVSRVLLVTGKGKNSIEDHFDEDAQLIRMLRETGKERLLADAQIASNQLKFFYTRQCVQLGLGDAVLCARDFAGQEPFAVALGDSIIGCGKSSQILQTAGQVFFEHKADAVIIVEEVPAEEVSHYGIVAPKSKGNVFEVGDLIEKPEPNQAPSNFAIAARYVFSPKIFDYIKNTTLDSRGELQLTDAIRNMLNDGGKVFGLCLPTDQKRYDIGNIKSYYETFVEFALRDPEYGAAMRQHARQLLEQLK